MPVEVEAVNSPSGGCDSVSVDYSSPSVSFSCQLTTVCQAAPVQTKGEKGAGKSKNGSLHITGIHLHIFLKFNLKREDFFYYCCLLAAFCSCFSFLISETTAEIFANDSVTC